MKIGFLLSRVEIVLHHEIEESVFVVFHLFPDIFLGLSAVNLRVWQIRYELVMNLFAG